MLSEKTTLIIKHLREGWPTEATPAVKELKLEVHHFVVVTLEVADILI